MVSPLIEPQIIAGTSPENYEADGVLIFSQAPLPGSEQADFKN